MDRKSFVCMTSISIVVIVFCMLNYSYYDKFSSITFRAVENNTNKMETDEEFGGIYEKINKKKLILGWTTVFGEPFGVGSFESCPENRCTLTNDRTLERQASALIFHIRDLKWNDVPANRTSNQRYVFYLQESPHHTGPDVDIMPNFFNWTMTYRLDSDMPALYGPLMRKKENFTSTIINSTEILGKNKKMLVWFVSNCKTPSKRELYVKNLSKYISVDIYGACGPLKCSKDSWPECNKMIGEKYKFYLAFENSLCKDYVTEKYYSRMYLNSIPIVMKRNIVRDILPEDSYIAADDFKNPKELAWYLTDLSKYPEKYLNYFKWRSLYEPVKKVTDYCLLCQKLWDKKEPRKSYKKMSAWWSDNVCDVNFVEKHLA